MQTIQVVLDTKLLKAVDTAASCDCNGGPD